MQKLLGIIFIDFFSQMVDINIDHVGEGVKIIIPYMLGDHRSRQHLPLVSQKIFEQAVFFSSELNFMVFAFHFVADQIQSQASELQCRPGFNLSSSEQDTDSGQ